MMRIAAFGLMTFLAGCGAVYISPQVGRGDVDVRVLPLTVETVAIANRENGYTPRSLPAAFSQTAGMGAGLRGAGALPDAPVEPVQRPTGLERRVPPPVSPQPYTIGVADVVVLSTRRTGSTVEELSGLLAAQSGRQGYTVQDDGAIAIPEVGRIALAGMTLDEAEAALFRALVENQIEPTFSLEIAEFNSKRVSIGGAVRNPAVVPIRLTPLYLQEALTAAGGVTAASQDLVSVRIYRDGTLYQIPLSDLYADQALQRLPLVDGDSVFVDTAFQLDAAQEYFAQQIQLSGIRQQARAQALSELQAEIAIRRGALAEARQTFSERAAFDAVERDYVYLAGEFSRQARFPLPFDRKATLADAIYENNGIQNATANPSQIYLLRASQDPRDAGAVTAWQLDASNPVNLLQAARMELRPDDIVFVAEQPITRWNRALAQLLPFLISTAGRVVE